MLQQTAPYESFLGRVEIFKELGKLPVPLPHLKEDITALVCAQNGGSWHKSCHKKFDMDKLEREKRKRESSEVQGLEIKKPRLHWQSFVKLACIFCDQEMGDLLK